MPVATTVSPLRIGGFQVQVDGRDDAAAETLLMLHGWPDSAALWDGQMALLAPHFRCVRLTLPGYGPGDARRAVPLDEVVAGLGAVAEHFSPQRPVVLMVHDWGCIFGYTWVMRQPERVSRLVGVDIGDAGSRAHVAQLGVRQKAGIFGYQAWLALAWWLGGDAQGGLGTRMTRWMAARLGCPTPTPTVHAGMNYPYYITWTRRHGSYRGARTIDAPCPMLFVHGRRKPVPFHSKAWAEALAARPGCRVVELRAGHWMMIEQPQAFNEALAGWLLPGASAGAGEGTGAVPVTAGAGGR